MNSSELPDRSGEEWQRRPPIPIQLKSFEWLERDKVKVSFDAEDGKHIEVLYTLTRKDGNVSIDHSPSVLWHYEEGAARDIQALRNSVMRFCFAAQRELTGADPILSGPIDNVT